MDFLDEFTCKAQQSFGGVDVHLYENASPAVKSAKEVLLVAVNTLTQQNLEDYCKFHRSWIKNRRERASKSGSDAFSYIFLYDLRGSDTKSFADSMQLLKQKVELHRSLTDEYTTDLLCSALIMNSAHVRNLTNAVFKFMYTPCRPVRVVASKSDFEEFSQEVHDGKQLEPFTETCA